jgi:putative ABC transport system permease protein
MKKHPWSNLDEDIRDHIERETQDNIERGMSAEEAHYAALRKFGNVTMVREDTRAVWIPVWIDQLRQDIRYAVRTIGRAPGFAAIAAGSSALGIGACAVVFAILNFAILKPLPVDQPDRLMSVSQSDRRTGQVGNELSYPDFQDLRRARCFEGIAAFNALLPVSVALRDDPERHWGSLATANYFAVAKPGFAAGRGFDASRDDRPGEPPVVVLSHDLWSRRFAGDRRVVGRTIWINNRAATVIGVTAAGFRGTDVGFVPELWIPFSMIEEDRVHSGRALENRQRYWLTAVARLRPGVDLPAAHAELDGIARRLHATVAPGDEHRGFHLERAGQLDPRLRTMALALFSVSLGVTVLVLLVACTNVANLLLGRAASRTREIAARMALGASRFRLLRQLLTESLLLALLGGIGGWIIAAQVASLFGFLRTPFGWPLDLSISLDYRVLLFCIALSVVTAVAFGLVPALQATRLDVITHLKADVRGSVGGRFGFRKGLVVAQVAVCTVLLVCMGLFLRSLQAARGMDLGLTTRNVLLMAFDPGLASRPDPESRQLLRHILETARAVPGVESTTLTTAVPLTFIIDNSNFVPAENATKPQALRVRTDIYAVGPQFFATMGISFLAGEDFRFDQPPTGGLAIVNDAFARAAFPNESPIGRRVLGDGKALEIVGLVATAKSRTIGEDPRPAIFLPILTEYSAARNQRGVTLVVRTRDAAASYAGQLREAIRHADPSLAVFDVRTMESHLREALIVPRLAWVLSAFAGSIGVVIAIVGIYGVMSFAVERRRRELGIRLAFGARPREMLVMILRQGLTLAGVGTAVGVFMALGLTRFAATLLYGVNPTDSVTFVVVPSFLMAVALLACALPARAAARLDPVDVLRGE